MPKVAIRELIPALVTNSPLHRPTSAPATSAGPQRQRHALKLVEHSHGDDPGHRLGRADAQVDLAEQDDHHHADPGDGHQRGVAQHVLDIDGGKEDRRQQRNPHAEQDQRQQQSGLFAVEYSRKKATHCDIKARTASTLRAKGGSVLMS